MASALSQMTLPVGGQTKGHHLPDDILLLVMAHVSATASQPSDVVGLKLVCKRWRQLASDPAILRESSLSALAIHACQWSPPARLYLKQAVDAGSLEAAFILGMILFYCVPEERSEGGRLLVRAGRDGHAAALFAAAIISFNGSGWGRQSKDLKMGVALCARSAALGNVEAVRELGHCLLDGFGTKQDQVEGWKLLLQAHMMELSVQPQMPPALSERLETEIEAVCDADLASQLLSIVGERCTTATADESQYALMGGAGTEHVKRVGVWESACPVRQLGLKRCRNDREMGEMGGLGSQNKRRWPTADAWKLYGNNRPMAMEKQQAVLQELISRSKSRSARATTKSCLASPRQAPATPVVSSLKQEDCCQSVDRSAVDGALKSFLPHALTSEISPASTPANRTSTISLSAPALQNNEIAHGHHFPAPDCVPAVPPRPLSPRSAGAQAAMEAAAADVGNRASGSRHVQRRQPRSRAAQALHMAAQGANVTSNFSGPGASSAATSGSQGLENISTCSDSTAAGNLPSATLSTTQTAAMSGDANGRQDKASQGGSVLVEALSTGSHDGTLRAEDLVRIVHMVGSGLVPDAATKGLKSILTYLQTSSVRRSPHPANAFLLEWYGRTGRWEGRSVCGKLTEGLQFCGRETCGKPETRPMEFWRCSCCWSARYCSRSCQLHDWRLRHSAECRPSANIPQLRQQWADRQPNVL